MVSQNIYVRAETHAAFPINGLKMWLCMKLNAIFTVTCAITEKSKLENIMTVDHFCKVS